MDETKCNEESNVTSLSTKNPEELTNSLMDSGNLANDDPYAYINRKEFTSEKFKVEVRNLPKYYGVKELKKLLNSKLKLNPSKLKLPLSCQRSSWIYVCFKSEKEKLIALKVLNNYKWKGFNLKAEEAKPVPDPLVQKRKLALNDNISEAKRIKTNLDSNESIKDASTPFWHIPYEEQLERKTQLIKSILKNFGSKLIKVNPDVMKWWREQKTKFNGLPCELHPIRHSEMIDGYRNKCEFSIGINKETGEKTVGFRLGKYAEGSTSVAPIDDVPHVPTQMKVAAKIFQDYIQSSEYDVFNYELNQGYWKQLSVRYSFTTKELMLIIGLDPQEITKEIMNGLKSNIKDYFTEGPGKLCKVNSLYLQIMKKKKSQDDEPEHEHIYGYAYITEQILGKTFRISPKSFFQVNTMGAEILYNSIAEVSELSKDATLLDVCCGTGSIGICLSDKSGDVLGLELSTEAIADAKANAEYNNVKNAQFFSGKAEEILGCVASKSSRKEIIAVVDPPRAGLRNEAIIQIRKNKLIKKLVYVACDPKRALKNFIDLGRPLSKIYRESPFLPVKAIPVDLFPHTNHCELVIYFEREPQE